MLFINAILYALNWVKDIFKDAYEVVHGWWWPFNLLEVPLYWLYRAFYSLVLYFKDFGDWVNDVADKLKVTFSWDNVKGLILSWLPWLYDVGEWFANKWKWLTTAVGDWWDDTKVTVQGWITIATEGFNALRVLWDEFRVTTLPNLVSFTWLTTWWNGRVNIIESWINSAFLERDSWWAGWQDFRDKVALFFEDPLEFLWSRFTDWFLGPEE